MKNEKPCAYEPCGKMFRPRKDLPAGYCSDTCSWRHNAQMQAVVRAKAGKTKSSKEAKRQAEAKRLGVPRDQLLDAKLEEYWRKVADPDYYSEMRGYGFRSALVDIG